jgi:flagellar FliL protein
MAANRTEAKPAEVSARAGAQNGAAASGKGGGSFVPLIANIILMPALAYAMTTFVLIPKLQGGKAAHAETEKEGEAGSHGGGGGESKHGSPKGRVTVPLSGKVLVNVAGTAGTRYIVASITMVGKSPEFKDQVERNDPQLKDVAAGILSGKTLSDVDKPGMRNIIRAELISAFNDILGKEAIADIYLTDFAIQ